VFSRLIRRSEDSAGTGDDVGDLQRHHRRSDAGSAVWWRRSLAGGDDQARVAPAPRGCSPAMVMACGRIVRSRCTRDHRRATRLVEPHAE
jgi:hypothetical protein